MIDRVPTPVSRAPAGASRVARVDDAGFTLVEVMVDVLILGILIGVASPTLLGARSRAWDLAARASVRTSATTAVILSEFRSDFTLASPAALRSAEPGVTFVGASEASSGPKVVSVDATSPRRWVAVARSNSGSCFAVVLGGGGQTLLDSTPCAAADIDTAAPGAPGEYTGTQVFQGAAGAVTPGMCLEVVAGGFVEQQPCSVTQGAIRVHTRSDGYSTVSSIDGNCFGTEGAWVAALVVDKRCVESIDQLWTVVPAVGGLVQFKNAETGWCMDVYGYSSAAGARIIQWGGGSSPNGTCKTTTSANNQTFSLG